MNYFCTLSDLHLIQYPDCWDTNTETLTYVNYIIMVTPNQCLLQMNFTVYQSFHEADIEGILLHVGEYYTILYI